MEGHRRRSRIWVGAFLVLAIAVPAGSPAAEALSPGTVFRDCKTCPEMVVVPKGYFAMGSNTGRLNERPAHMVLIRDPFAVSRHEITFDDWAACAVGGSCVAEPDDHGWGRGRRPVINVTWQEAVDYAAWLSRETGHTYRLPNEAEWEYAARAGTTTEYWWGDRLGQGRANCRDCNPEISHQTEPVGSFRANPFGLFDMHGNVWEWVLDCWNEDHANAPRYGGARHEGDCRFRVVRGGSWYYFGTNLRSAYRSKFAAEGFSYGIGIRVLRELPRDLP